MHRPRRKDTIPAHSYLYLSNTRQVSCLSYEADAFGARFLIANASRDNAVVKGEDTITFGPDNSVNQTMFVYGRSVYQDQEKSLIVRDEAEVRKSGRIKTEFTSR